MSYWVKREAKACWGEVVSFCRAVVWATTVFMSLFQALRHPSWWNLVVESVLRSCSVQLCAAFSFRSIWYVFWGTAAGAECYENKSAQAGHQWEENCKTYQSYSEAATKQKGVKRTCDLKNVILWSQKCVCVLSTLQKLCWELLTVLPLPQNWYRSPLMCYTIMPFTLVFHLGMICCCLRALNILSCSNPQQPLVTW